MENNLVIFQRYRSLYPIIIGLLLLTGQPVRAASTVVLDDRVNEFHLGQDQLQVLRDSPDQLTINEITTNSHSSFTDADQNILNFGHTADSIWIRFRLVDKSVDANDSTWMLESAFPLLARFDVYVVADGRVTEKYQLGYEHKMKRRMLPHRFFVQPLRFERNIEYDIYINVERANGNVQVPLKLSRPLTFFYSELISDHVFGIFFGILIGMIAYNLFLFFSVGSRAYFYYIAYIVFSFAAYQALTGYGFLLIWSQLPAVNEYIIQISASLGVISGLLFIKHFIKMEQYARWFVHYIHTMVGIGVVLITTKLVTTYFLSIHITLYLGFVTLTMPLMVLYCWRKGSRPAGFFMLAWITLTVGIVLYAFNLLGWVPSSVITTNAILWGAAAEMILLSLGLADRINSERRQKYSALQEQHKAVIQLKEAEEQLMHRALHSRATGLPNRTLLRNTMDNLLENDESRHFTLLLLSLNNFHEFNKTLGHSNGDAILGILTKRICTLCKGIHNLYPIETQDREHNLVSSIEGVTFALLIKELDTSVLQSTILKLLRDVEKPFEYQGLTLDVDATAGIASCPSHGEDSETLMRNAHIALEAASSTNEKFSIYSHEIDPYNARRISLLGELRNAIEKDALQLYFQPQICLDTMQVSGAEVLIRWIHPEYGFIPPDEFIPLAERTGVIHPLTYWICRKAFEFKHSLDSQGYDINLSINISARNLQDPHFKEQVCKMAAENKVQLNKIIMELTETAVMYDPEDALRIMNDLSEAGIRLSIDDFGTGYSSLSYLKRLPVDEIKIDRSFVMEMAKNNDDQVIVNTTLMMGHNLSLEVVAEGVEDEATLYKLKDMGCDLAQGYHIARPMPSHDFFTWISGYRAHQRPQAVIKGV
ncbi:MAG: EAL domain-containing protein [Ketobacter sp.]